jgi:hypothetical protein
MEKEVTFTGATEGRAGEPEPYPPIAAPELGAVENLPSRWIEVRERAPEAALTWARAESVETWAAGMVASPGLSRIRSREKLFPS